MYLARSILAVLFFFSSVGAVKAVFASEDSSSMAMKTETSPAFQSSQASNVLGQIAMALAGGSEAMRALRGSQSEDTQQDPLRLPLPGMNCGINRILSYVSCYSAVINNEKEAENNGRVIAESGAIIDYILRRHGNGRLQPDPASAAYDDYVHWLHYTEGSAMPALILKITVSRLGDAGASLGPHLDNELSSHLGYINDKLEGRNYLLGDELTAADIQLSFFGELASARTGIASYPNIGAWVNRFQARPPYKAALERGGAHSFA